MAKKPSDPASSAPPTRAGAQDAAFYTALLGNLPGMAYHMLNQPDWPAEFISEGSLALTGYAPAALLAGGERAYGDLIHPDDRERVWTEIQIALEARQPFQLTYRIYTAEGTLKWVLEQGSGVYDDAGNLLSLAGFVADISEQRRIQTEREHFTTRLSVASEIAGQVQTILDPDELLQAVIPLIKERFGLYYVHVYTVDEAAGELKLRAGYGEPGRIMVERGHSIPLDREASLVATAARTKEVVLVQDVTANPDFLPNPLLPDTKSEVAVPAIAGGKVLGVFDVQHDETHYFTDADLDVFHTLAGQIATAFQNAELFATQQQAEAEIRVFQALAEASADGILMANPQNALLTYANAAAHQLFGCDYESREMINMPGAQFWAEEELPRLGAVLEQALQQGWQGDVLQRRLDGTTFAANATVFALQDATGAPSQLVIMVRDITDRKQAEETLRANEERLSLALQAGRVGIWEFWPQKNEVFYNPTWYTMLDYAPYELPQDSSTWESLVHPDDVAHANTVLQHGIETGNDFALQFRMKAKNGEWRWIQAYGYITERTPEGMTARVIGTHTDITEQKLAQDEAFAQAERNRALLDTIPDMMFVFNQDGVFLEFKAEAGQELLVPPEIFLGKAITEVLPPQISEMTLGHLRNVLQTGESVTYEYQAPVGDALHTYEARMSRVAENQVLTIVRDITDRKQAEAERERLAAVLSNSQDFIGMVDMAGNTVYVNPAGLQMCGYEDLEAVLGKPIAIFHLPEDAQRLAETVMPTLLETGTSRVENRLLRTDGTLIPVDQTLFVIRDAQGNPQNLATFMTDITERKQAEAALQENEERLGLALEAAEAAVWEFLPLAGEAYFDDRWYTMLGYAPQELPQSFDTWRSLLHPDDLTKSEPIILETIQRGGDFSREFRMKTKDGGWRWIEAIGKTISTNEDGVTTRMLGTHTDITERKQAEIERERFTTRLNVASEIAGQVQSILDPDALLQAVIPLIKERFGLYYVHVYTVDEAAGELKLRTGYGEPGRIMVERGHSIPLDREASLVATAARTKEPVLVQDVTENPNFLPNPLLPDTKSEVAMPAIAGGKVLGVFDVQHDEPHYFTDADLDVFQTLAGQIATAFQNAELYAETQRAAARNQALLQTIPDMMFVFNQDGIFLEFKAEAGQELLVPPEIFLGKAITEVLPPQISEMTLGHLRNVLQTGESVIYEYQAPVGDALHTYEARMSRVAENQVLTIVRDITDRKQAEQAQARLLAILESTTDLISTAWPDGRIIYMNTAGRRMVGWEDQDLSTHAIPDIHPEWARRIINEVSIPAIANEGIWQGETAILSRDGKEMPVLQVIMAHKSPTGEMEYLSTIMRDITELKSAAAERERALTETRLRLEISQALAGDKTEDQIWDALLQKAGFYPQAQVTLATVEEKDGRRYFTQVRGSTFQSGLQALPNGATYTDEQYPMLQQVNAYRRFVTSNTLEDKALDQASREVARYLEVNSAALLPITYGNEWLGVISVAIPEVGFFDDPSHIYLYQTLAEQGATALHAAQLRDDVRQSEERFRGLYESSPLGIILNDFATGAYLEANDAFLHMIGYTLEELNQLSYFDLTPQEHADEEQVQLRSMETIGRYGPFEKEYIHKDGSVFPVVLNGVVVTDNTGRQIIWSTVEDITKRRQAEEALRLTRASVEQARDAFFWFDGDARFTDVSERTCELLGYSRAELLRMAVFDVDADFPVAAWPGLKEQLRQTGSIALESRHRTKAGRIYPVEVTVSYLAFGEQEQYFSIARDITDRKRADAERERFATQLSTAAEISRQVGTILDTDALLKTVIPLLKERFGLYHAQLYVVDEATGDLVLRVGYGQVGEIMLQQGHRITVDQEQSLVARAARNKDVAVANDVLEEQDFMPNLLLPETRSEVAVPAMIGDRVIGVFDVQSDEANTFSDADLDVYRTLAGQIANAFQTALLFEQQRQAEAALRAAAEKTRAVFEAMTEGLVVTGMMGRVEDLNDATLALHGYTSREELLGRSTMQLFARPFWSKAAEAMRQALEKGRSDIAEYRMLRHNQSTFDAEMNAALLRDANGNPAGFVTITRDVSTRKEAEMERTRFATRLRTAAEISSQVTSILDPQLLLRQVVTLIKEQFDLYHVHVYTLDETTQELVLAAGYGEAGKTMLTQGHRIPLEAEQSLVARAARTKEPVLVADTTTAPDFMPNPLLPKTRSEVAVPAIFSGKVLGVFDVQHDAANHFTEADLDVFRTLAGQVATAFQNARYFEEIQEAAERLREVDRMKSEFLANMSHELRTPLNSIIGYAEVMLMGIDGELEPETREDIQAIYENGQHLLTMINDILDLAKIESGRMTLKMEAIDVEQLLDEMRSSGLGLLRKYHKEDLVELVIEAEADLPHLHGDRIRLNQILNNLLSNAVKFTERGSIQVRAYRRDNNVYISVKDTGIGIAESQLEKIFEKFRQVDGSAKRRAEGTGLGLAITRYLVEMHGGAISVRSAENKGSVFTISLPAFNEATE